ncbi:hypothetical protein SAMN04487972_13819 [Paracoccus halophilus]|uniref:DUF4410 domain-containing protein n=2 Tax=Paracoccus halophilus TaxID=376733 RepID=A0A099F6Z2_9RHOB|nr:hypothetical protein IT41_04245 [Paracoccus halophilus]SFA61656.1 hypothetical protein SAMN04487972_13819 [Paracoccus halophilus]
MKRHTKLLAALAVGAALAGCAGSAPDKAALTAEQTQLYTAQRADIDVSAVAEGSRGRKVSAEEIKAALESRSNLVKWRGGRTEAVVSIKVTSVNILSAGQSMMLGGESVMLGTVALLDARSGEPIVAPIEISSGGGGYYAGGIIGVMSLEDKNTELEQLAQQFMTRARLALTGPTTTAQTNIQEAKDGKGKV